MASKKDQARIKLMLERLAILLRTITEEETPGKKWDLAFLDVRWPTTGGGEAMKLRIRLDNGALIKSVDVSMDQAKVRYELSKIRQTWREPEWYGLKITVFPSEKYSVEYDKDPGCANDESFYDFDV